MLRADSNDKDIQQSQPSQRKTTANEHLPTL